eukprot:CAMPEP_0117612620 /NCGR_PEP_ID=MMETSP0784-20121206/83041_1 /TAXON_ID=39447 /ORGANISM="" /LENGTH=222 /DNA_ID=CAMNT_0005416177 /DNA_START=25 /DNA_END=693 /DNA_ORIENTATION=-
MKDLVPRQTPSPVVFVFMLTLLLGQCSTADSASERAQSTTASSIAVDRFMRVRADSSRQQRVGDQVSAPDQFSRDSNFGGIASAGSKSVVARPELTDSLPVDFLSAKVEILGSRSRAGEVVPTAAPSLKSPCARLVSDVGTPNEATSSLNKASDKEANATVALEKARSKRIAAEAGLDELEMQLVAAQRLSIDAELRHRYLQVAAHAGAAVEAETLARPKKL